MIKIDEEAFESEVLEILTYLEKVEKELQHRETMLVENQQEQSELLDQLQRVNIERGLRQGRVMQLQAIELFRRDMRKRLKKLREKEEQIRSDVHRAKERREMVVDELRELRETKSQ
jgi:DNA repair exonuclease SbcCD ATPase subunit